MTWVRSLLLGCLLVGATACGGSSLYRIAVVNDVRAEGLLRMAKLERQWFEAGLITGADHAEWVRNMTLAAEAGKRLTQSIRLADDGLAYEALAELLRVVKLLAAEGGLTYRLPENLQMVAQLTLDGVILALSTMQMTLEASHDPAAFDSRDLAFVYLPREGGDFPGRVDGPAVEAALWPQPAH